MKKAAVLATILTFCSVSFSYPAQKNKGFSREKITKAEGLYNEAVVCYEKGDFEKAEKLYNRAMTELSSSNLSADMGYQLKYELDNLFTKIDDLMEKINTQPLLEVPAEELAAGKFENEKIKIRKKYTIPIDNENEITKKYIELYTNERRKDLIEKALERMGMYKDMVLSVLKEEGLPEELVYLPVVESLYKVNAYSHAGAVGLWQIMRTTGRNLGLVINYWVDERRDPEKSTRAAAKYLKELYRWFNDWHLALAAYNRGEGGIGKDLGFSKATDYYQLQDRQALPNETHMFVPKFMACTIIGDNYKDYGLDPDFEKPLQYDEVTVNNVIDLEIVAKCAGSTGGEIRKLNPAISAWCTPNNYPDFKLKLPRGAKDAFFTNIAQVKDLNPSAGVIRYTVVKGDLLGSIAKKFNTTVYAIKRDNNITNVNFIRPKQKLIIRPGRNYFSKKGRETEDED